MKIVFNVMSFSKTLEAPEKSSETIMRLLHKSFRNLFSNPSDKNFRNSYNNFFKNFFRNIFNFFPEIIPVIIQRMLRGFLPEISEQSNATASSNTHRDYTKNFPVTIPEFPSDVSY